MTDRDTQKRLGFDPARLARIERWMADHVASGRLPGLAVQIKRHGVLAFSERIGHSDVETDAPVSADTIWRIYSMTKPVTSLAIMMLYEEGHFQLDQPVADFIPDFARLPVWRGGDHNLHATNPLARPITIHDLLTHQSGLVYGDPEGNVVERAYTEAGLDFDRPGDCMTEAIGRLCRLPLAFQPGARWGYGLSTDVLGHLVEVISGNTLGAFFKSRIFDPLGMRDTDFVVPAAKRARLAALYEREGARIRRVVDTDDNVNGMAIESGGGGLYSTMDDYQAFASMLLARGRTPGGRLVGRKTFDLMASNHMGDDLASRGQSHFSETTFEGIGFGLGFSVMLDPQRAKIPGSPGEFAWGGMASTAFWVDPAEQMTVILMTQLIPSSAYALRRQLRVLSYAALVD
ncbi:serine hydrolase domain-containing protein [Rhizobium sp. FKL33]|uniref:serine hydrolase domain-containing protein n=1 Tax=Rhizobium sp. FKL33 TaxID=2562307 RepID=UPI001FEE135C|nr:serine hydrolase domain-containing protein [Rhizobium sp. FKL33]